MSETRQRKAPTSVTVTPPAAPLPAPPDPPAPLPEADETRKKCLTSLNFAIVRMSKEIAYFRDQMRSAWETVTDFDEVPHLKEIMVAIDPLLEELERKVKTDDLLPKASERPRSTQHIVTKSD